MATWRSKNTPFLKSCTTRSWVVVKEVTARGQDSLPQSRPMPTVGKQCHELRINDEDLTWRILYKLDSDAIVILEVFDKKTAKTPKQVIEVSKNRLRNYNRESK